jgi:hypothetical protein
MTQSIRPKILKQYYERAYGQQFMREEAFLGATFDEYYHLQRIQFPRMSRRKAAEQSGKQEYLKQVASLPPDPPRVSESLPHHCLIARKPDVDLAQAGIEAEVQNLTLDRVKAVTGWEALRQQTKLESLNLILWAGERGELLAPPLSLPNLDLRSCSLECTRWLLESTRVRSLYVQLEEAEPLDLSPLEAHTRLEKLRTNAGQLRGVGRLAKLPLTRLFLSRVVPGVALHRVLQARADSLLELGLMSDEPFGPSLLPELPSLERLEVPAFDVARAEWIDWAVAHPQVACRFLPLEEEPKKQVVRLAELYRDIDILLLQKGKQTSFEVAGNLVEDVLDTDELDNGELEDQMRALAKKEGKKAQWSSERDTLVMQAKDIETCRWLIDSVYALKGQKQSPSPSPARRKQVARKR